MGLRVQLHRVVELCAWQGYMRSYVYKLLCYIMQLHRVVELCTWQGYMRSYVYKPLCFIMGTTELLIRGIAEVLIRGTAGLIKDMQSIACRGCGYW